MPERSASPENEFFHVLKTQQFDRSLLDGLCELTTTVRRYAKHREGLHFLRGLLSEKRAMLYFTQPSTRTFLSFNNACQILGIQTSEIRDSATSSEVKGESLLDSLRTFSSYVDVVIMRTKEEGLAESAAELFDRIHRRVPIVNAGSGKDQHPTQALLDIYTLERSFMHRGGIDGKVIGMMGDLKRGRTVRSLSYLMKNYRDVKLVFISPPAFRMEEDIKAHLREHGVTFTETEDMEAALPSLDAIYITRIQDEHDVSGESSKVDLSRFKFRVEHLAKLKEDGVIMHPLPRRDEIHPDVDNDPRAKYWRQERNGMWMRVAILTKIFGVDRYLQQGSLLD
ncbi:MAG TPA: aspartate carbamoyltransferase [Fibrobacteres bacterium]|jgi:aspartate carbamoyltransferase catalytic subunit|nr:aspartate carbamoyltransferase [Fibrobacterota bacterium]